MSKDKKHQVFKNTNSFKINFHFYFNLLFTLNRAELLNLKTHLKDTEVKLNHTTMIVDETSNSVRGVHDEALSIYTEIHALNIPDIDTVAIKEDAQNTGAQVG